MDSVIIINKETFGSGDLELGTKLMGAFLRKLWAKQNKPDAIILYNAGVKLAAFGSPVLEVFHGLHEAGVDILACGTCVDHYGIDEAAMEARVSNMEELSDLMLSAASVITV